MAFDGNNKVYFLLNEKDPKLLLKLDQTFNLVDSIQIEYCDDLSGADYDELTNSLWVISDESKMVLQLDLMGNLINKFYVDIPQVEGIAVDSKNNIIYLVSDKTENLYVCKIRL